MRLDVLDEELVIHTETAQDRTWVRTVFGLKADRPLRVTGLERMKTGHELEVEEKERGKP
jgi:hypothetical protein